MFKLDREFVEECGLGDLPPERANEFLNWFYDVLETRVGYRLADRMSSAQLDAFESLINAGDDDGALQWLSSYFPDYRIDVADEVGKLKSEVIERSHQLLAAANS